MPLLNADEVKARVTTSLADPEITKIIEAEEAVIVRRFGANEGSLIERIESDWARDVYLPRRIDSITTVTEGDGTTQETLTEDTDFRVWAEEGRVERVAELGAPIAFQRIVDITYVAEDDKVERRHALVELCRIAIERQAMKHEAVGQGDYSYTAPNWEAEREKILKNLLHFPHI